MTSEIQRMMGVTSGLELLTLPHGRQLRLDLLERYVVGGVRSDIDHLRFSACSSCHRSSCLFHPSLSFTRRTFEGVGS